MKHAVAGQRHYCLALRKRGFSADAQKPFLIVRPNTGLNTKESYAFEFLSKYQHANILGFLGFSRGRRGTDEPSCIGERSTAK